MMKSSAHAKVLTACMILCLFLCGCSRTYRMNRLRDLADCVTLTWGLGVGAMVMIGPINTGLGMQWDVAGFRDGESTTGENSASVNALFISYQEVRKNVFGRNNLPTRTADYYMPKEHMKNQWDKLIKNGATFYNRYPLIAQMEMAPAVGPAYHARQYYTQIEVCAGLIYSGFRVGVNPGELVDFLLGFSGIDIYGDDVYPYRTLWDKLHANKENASEPVTKKL